MVSLRMSKAVFWRLRALKSGILGAALLLLLTLSASSEPKLMGVDIYGTDRITAGEVRTKFWNRIQLMSRKKASRRPADRKEAEKLKKEMEDSIRKSWDLHWARLAWMDYYNFGEHQVYITFDVVEKIDVKKRMPFHPVPTQTLSDPDGLLAAWSQYSDLGWNLVRRGDISSDRPECPGLYCLWGSLTPELKALETQFINLVAKNKEALIRIVGEDKNPTHRANATYLLGYANDPNGYARVLSTSLDDPDMEVQAAALRVYSDLAIYHKDIHLPVEQIATALDYPAVEIRNKALAVVTAMADNPVYRSYFLKRTAPQVLKLMRLDQPANHDLAYSFLGILSKKKYGEKDFAAWESWVLKAQAMPLESPQN